MKKSLRLTACCLALLCAISATDSLMWSTEARGDDRTTYLLRAGVIGASGARGQTTAIVSNGTLGQPQPIGLGTGGDVNHIAGFWGAAGYGGLPSGVDVPPVLTNRLQQSFANPLLLPTVIAFSCARPGPVDLSIYNIRGARVRTLVRQTVVAGFHRVAWDGRDDRGGSVAAGLYFCRLSMADFRAVKKMVLVK